MLVNTTSLNALRIGFSAAYKRGLDQADSQYKKIATVVPSTTKENKYGWLGKMPNMREWIGPRVVHGLAEHDYAIKNLPFELTIAVDRDDIEDDNLGIYDPMFVNMGESVAAHPDLLCFGALKDGFTTECYDGQNFFDTDHPVLSEDGAETTVSNMTAGSSSPWFLLCTNRSLKPIIYQERRKAQFVAHDNPKDESVFRNKEFVYGTDGRWNAGYGFWQMAHGSKAEINAENYATARSSIIGMKGDHGRPLGLVPNLLVVGASNEGAAREILMNERDANGATNKWRNTAELLVAPWLD
jgi:phage major head subunit gpT-like protein